MGFRRRRRRRTVQWFPPIGTAVNVDQDVTRKTGVVTFELDVLNGSEINIDLALTFDFGTEELQAFASENTPTMTLSDLQGSSWRCRRIVGNIWAAYFPGSIADNEHIGVNTAPTACQFKAGLMVRAVEGQASNTVRNASPLDSDDWTDPWIWQRGWILGQSATINNASPFPGPIIGNDLYVNRPVGGGIGGDNGHREVGFSFFPNCNAWYGSVKDGPHVDAKTNRIIAPEERLMLTLATQKLPLQPNTAVQNVGKVIGAYDLRLLGSIMRSTNRRNASR